MNKKKCCNIWITQEYNLSCCLDVEILCQETTNFHYYQISLKHTCTNPPLIQFCYIEYYSYIYDCYIRYKNKLHLDKIVRDYFKSVFHLPY